MREPVPGLFQRATSHLKANYSRLSKRYKFPRSDIDTLTVEEVYAQSPNETLLNQAPRGTGLKEWHAWNQQLEKTLDQKGMNAWSENLAKMLHERSHPKRKSPLQDSRSSTSSRV